MRFAVVSRLMAGLLLIAATSGCQIGPELPKSLDGQAVLVMGYSTDFSEFARGGSVATGFILDTVNDELLEPSLGLYEFIKLQPGQINFSGHCFWRFRGGGFADNDLWEPGQLSFEAKADHRYTVSVQIDEYKARCNLKVIETRHND